MALKLFGSKAKTRQHFAQHDYGNLIQVRLGRDDLTETQFERLSFAYSYYDPRLKQMADWVFASKETSNFTYDVTDLSKKGIIGAASMATGLSMQEIAAYLDEASADRTLFDAVVARAGSSTGFDFHDPTCLFGRRLGWYAVARATKPRVIIETGVDAGLGSMLLASALRRNAQEGHPGHHYGTDIDPDAGFLMHGPWQEFSTMLYGDSIESLKAFEEPVDLFINDSDHSATYEADEYKVIGPKLSPHAIVLGDNSHVTSALYDWSAETGRQFLFCSESPKDHWYPGAGIGMSFRRR